MNRRLVFLRRLLLVALILGGMGVGFISWMIANPNPEQLSLPDSLVSSTSDAGIELLERASAKADYAVLVPHFEAQLYRSYCGVASGVIAINTLGGETNQEMFFDGLSANTRGGWATFYTGMTLDQLGALLDAHALSVSVTHAAETTLEEFRTAARKNLATDDDLMLINYSRATLDQGSSGHISPLAAYDDTSDRFLVLDVSAYKYPPVWVEAASLFDAMNTLDPASGLTRGFVVLRQ